MQESRQPRSLASAASHATSPFPALACESPLWPPPCLRSPPGAKLPCLPLPSQPASHHGPAASVQGVDAGPTGATTLGPGPTQPIEQKVSVLDREDMWRRKHEVRIVHRQEIVSHGDEIDGDNEDVAEATTSLAIRPTMAERDWKTRPGVAEGVRRDRRGSAMDGAPDARGDRGSAAAGRLVMEGRSRRAWRGAADVHGR
uniref:Uncharacterized protein n=1 Tax=Oryza sativa subsp. japonica TaxID=39947 RepID=Q6ZGI5_ORYSJ|nr:hypothetical protein [Oryza sativa Japonica Group]BAD16947.1 hypothetical protein [Oryza sativa Japonica Group]